jgi:hypothetical protein
VKFRFGWDGLGGIVTSERALLSCTRLRVRKTKLPQSGGATLPNHTRKRKRATVITTEDREEKAIKEKRGDDKRSKAWAVEVSSMAALGHWTERGRLGQHGWHCLVEVTRTTGNKQAMKFSIYTPFCR